MKVVNKALLAMMLTLVSILWISNASAVPSFAAKYEKKCSYCHTTWPQLNKKGRQFKERGYRLKADLKDTAKKTPYFEQGSFPISGLLISRPYDKKEGGQAKVRAIHEAEIFIAGAINKNLSGFIEIEAEDETEFTPEIGPLALSYRFSDAANIQAVWGPAFLYDGYGLLADHFRMTRGHVGLIDQAFGGADNDGSLRSNRQSLNFTGRKSGVFYALGVSNGVAGDPEGEEPTLGGHGKIAYDYKDVITVGAFALVGEAPTSKRGYARTGFDVQSDYFANSRIQAAYVSATDDNDTNSAEVKNKATSLQWIYTVKTKDGAPTYVPIVRLDSHEENDGADKFQDLTLNLTYYLKENVKGYVEYWKQTDVPEGQDKESRVTLQVYVGF